MSTPTSPSRPAGAAAPRTRAHRRVQAPRRGGEPRALRGLRRTVTTSLTLALPVGLAAATLTGGVGLGSEPTVEPALRPAAAALPSAPLSTFTLNVLHDLNADQARADMEKGMSLGEVGGFQEMSDVEDRNTLIALCNAKDWGWYMPIGGGDAIPIVWNRQRFRLIDGRTVQTHAKVSDSSPARFVNVVRLRELATGKVFGIINTHAIANASFDAQLSDMDKIPLLRQHLQILRAQILALANQTETVFISGDLNVNYLADQKRQNAGLPTSALGDLVNFDMPGTGSHGAGSLLDYGMSLKNDGGLALQSSQIVYGFNSDHDAIAFRYNPVDVFAPGPTFNDPKGDSYAERDVVDRQRRALQDAEAGSTVRMVTSRLDDQSIYDQLLAASARGVNVQVIVGNGPVTDQELALSTALGGSTAAPSFLRKKAVDVSGNVLLVDRTGSATNLSLVASGPATSGAVGRFTNVYQSTDDALYAAYAGLFTSYVADAPVSARTVGAGRNQIAVFPTTKDPIGKALKRVKCTRARGIAVQGKRTNVWAQVADWGGSRGKSIAQRLVELDRQGCRVQVLSGKKVGKGIKKVLKQGGVTRKSARTAQNLLVVDGRYKKKGRNSLVWTGGPAWSDGALKSEGSQLNLTDPTQAKPYVEAYRKLWKAS